jgi:hypothetical protein
VVVTAGAFLALASAVTPACAAEQRAKPPVKKALSRVAQSGGGSGPVSLEWAVRAPLRP